MRRIKYNPFRPIKSRAFESLLDDVAGRSIAEFLGSDFVTSTPSVNIVEQNDSYDIRIAAPGLSKSNFEIDLDNDRLTISGNKEVEKSDESLGKITRREFNYSNFKRSFHVSEEISKEKITAEYIDGILTVSLPKKEPVEDVKTTIEIS